MQLNGGVWDDSKAPSKWITLPSLKEDLEALKMEESISGRSRPRLKKKLTTTGEEKARSAYQRSTVV